MGGKKNGMSKKRKILVGIGIGALAAYLFDPARGKTRRVQVRDRMMGKSRRLSRKLQRTGRHVVSDAEGMKERIANLSSEEKSYDDVTLAQKVSSELFLDPSLPKESININAEEGVVVLRGEVDQVKDIKKIEKQVRKIDGVDEVDNFLHVKGTPAPNKASARA